jgi:hypothetical protein
MFIAIINELKIEANSIQELIDKLEKLKKTTTTYLKED